MIHPTRKSPPDRARIRRDRLGVASIRAPSAEAAFEAWGRVHARDRFFQMDLLRRAAAGRLAELFGATALEADLAQRLLPLESVANQVLDALPASQRSLLDAYTRGINARLGRMPPTLEHGILRVRPARWRQQDSLLVMLQLSQTLVLDVPGQRMDRAMRAALPDAVRRFFLPRGDPFSAEPDRGLPIPVAEIEEVLEKSRKIGFRRLVETAPTGASNCWTVAADRCRRGLPILANDLHLPLATPNLFHRVDLSFPGGRGIGFAIPGIPLLVCGSNGEVSWGVANLPADCTRLLPAPPGATFSTRRESIVVKGGVRKEAVFRDSPDGPLLDDEIDGVEMILQWSLLWPESTHLGLTDLLTASDVEEARAVAHRGGGPPVAMLLADRNGDTLGTVCGCFPRRAGGRLRREFVPSRELPVWRNPAEGVLICANDPLLSPPGAVEVGVNYPASYRRHRIEECLGADDAWTEEKTHRLQKDNRAGFYDFYVELVREAIGVRAPKLEREAEIVRAVDAWDGCSGPDSLGVALLVEYRRHLVEHLFSWLLRLCTRANDQFAYAWRNPEPALRRLLRERPASLLPEEPGVASWEDYLALRLNDAARELRAGCRRPLDTIRWRDFLKVPVPHPLGGKCLTRWFNLPPLLPEGGLESVAAFGPGRGPALRLVVSPGAEEAAIAQMPGGQSGSPWSRHFGDHHRSFRSGTPVTLVGSLPVDLSGKGAN